MITINETRLWKSLMEMATIGATEKGGSSRLALTSLDGEGRERFIEWCQAEGMKIEVDGIGNLFAIREGKNPEAPPIVMGSHLDTQPKGGRFDGVYGVLAALEVIRTLNEQGIETEHNLEIAVWTNEEGARFSPAMMGSAVFVGEMSLEEGLAITDSAGISVGESLDRIGFRGERALKRPMNAYFEAHIEQGPILEAAEKSIGVVTGGQAIRWFDITVAGMPAHAGTTPMAMRIDPLFAVAHLLEQMAAQFSSLDQLLYTVGELTIENPSRNTIPDQVTFTLDLRHPDRTILDEAESRLENLVDQVAIERQCEAMLNCVWDSPATPFDEAMVDLVESATQQLGYPYQRMISGAGHDAIHLAKHTPTTMIFIPCEKGISHNEAELITSTDAMQGANVLLNALLARDKG